MLGKLRQFLAPEEQAANSSRERRGSPRADGGGTTVRIDSKVYPLSNWGPTGFMIDGFEGSLVVKQRFSAVLMLPEGDKTIEYRTDAVVVRQDGRTLGAKFLFLSPDAKRAIELRTRRAN